MSESRRSEQTQLGFDTIGPDPAFKRGCLALSLDARRLDYSNKDMCRQQIIRPDVAKPSESTNGGVSSRFAEQTKVVASAVAKVKDRSSFSSERSSSFFGMAPAHKHWQG